MTNGQTDIFEHDLDEDEEIDGVVEYDISSSANDFNAMTLYSFIESGSIKIPSFQRNYVWDIKRASRWIESLILGLPVPQLFLYEKSRNNFLVVDGQQRLLSVYYYMLGRFPRQDKRDAIRKIFDERNCLPLEYLQDNSLFQSFKLKLPGQASNQVNQLNNLSFDMLGDYQQSLNLCAIRCVVIKQNLPQNDDSSIYEIFSRLNTGGKNLAPQEIRACVYHSDFYDILQKLNIDARWRRLCKNQEPDLHMKDTETILRSFAMMDGGNNYKTTMARFLNDFSKKCMANTLEKNNYLRDLFLYFVSECESLPEDVFINKNNNKFNITLFEAVFAATCSQPYKQGNTPAFTISLERIEELQADPEFQKASDARTTNSANVKIRLSRALEILNQ